MILKKSTIKNTEPKNGFTIVELLVTITIIGILATIGTLSFTGIQKQSRDSQRMSKVTVISESLEKYYQENGVYPSCAELTQDSNKVTSSVLKGLDPDSLTAPGTNKGTNSISCSGAAINTYFYDTAGTNGLQYTLSYIEEESNDAKTIDSKYRMSALASTTAHANTLDDSQIIVNWDAIDSASDYRIQRATDTLFQNNLYEETVPGLSTTQNGLNAGTTYYFRVLAKALNASSGWSGIVNATTTVLPPT